MCFRTCYKPPATQQCSPARVEAVTTSQSELFRRPYARLGFRPSARTPASAVQNFPLTRWPTAAVRESSPSTSWSSTWENTEEQIQIEEKHNPNSTLRKEADYHKEGKAVYHHWGAKGATIGSSENEACLLWPHWDNTKHFVRKWWLDAYNIQPLLINQMLTFSLRKEFNGASVLFASVALWAKIRVVNCGFLGKINPFSAKLGYCQCKDWDLASPWSWTS